MNCDGERFGDYYQRVRMSVENVSLLFFVSWALSRVMSNQINQRQTNNIWSPATSQISIITSKCHCVYHWFTPSPQQWKIAAIKRLCVEIKLTIVVTLYTHQYSISLMFLTTILILEFRIVMTTNLFSQKYLKHGKHLSSFTCLSLAFKVREERIEDSLTFSWGYFCVIFYKMTFMAILEQSTVQRETIITFQIKQTFSVKPKQKALKVEKLKYVSQQHRQNS